MTDHTAPLPGALQQAALWRHPGQGGFGMEGFTHRAARLRSLGLAHPALQGYMELLASLADAQSRVAAGYLDRGAGHESLLPHANDAPQPALMWPSQSQWFVLLRALLDQLSGYQPIALSAGYARLLNASDSVCSQWAHAWLSHDFASSVPDRDILLGASLQLYGWLMARELSAASLNTASEFPQRCPCCNSLPVVSILRSFSGQQGVRYLHCPLCAGEWRLTRLLCAQCGNTQDISYQHITHYEGVTAECCPMCHTYIKQLDQEKRPLLDPLADELVALGLDLKLSEADWQRWSLNPLLLGALA